MSEIFNGTILSIWNASFLVDCAMFDPSLIAPKKSKWFNSSLPISVSLSLPSVCPGWLDLCNKLWGPRASRARSLCKCLNFKGLRMLWEGKRSWKKRHLGHSSNIFKPSTVGDKMLTLPTCFEWWFVITPSHKREANPLIKEALLLVSGAGKSEVLQPVQRVINRWYQDVSTRGTAQFIVQICEAAPSTKISTAAISFASRFSYMIFLGCQHNNSVAFWWLSVRHSHLAFFPTSTKLRSLSFDFSLVVLLTIWVGHFAIHMVFGLQERPKSIKFGLHDVSCRLMLRHKFICVLYVCGFYMFLLKKTRLHQIGLHISWWFFNSRNSKATSVMIINLDSSAVIFTSGRWWPCRTPLKLSCSGTFCGLEARVTACFVGPLRLECCRSAGTPVWGSHFKNCRETLQLK